MVFILAVLPLLLQSMAVFVMYFTQFYFNCVNVWTQQQIVYYKLQKLILFLNMTVDCC